MPDLWNTTNSYPAIAARWAEVAAEHQWKPSNGAITCPIVVTGRTCVGSNWGGSRACICQEVADALPGRHITDHPRRWVAPDGSRVVTYETYSPAEDVAAFTALCERRGIAVEIGGRSPHAPEDATLLIVRAAR